MKQLFKTIGLLIAASMMTACYTNPTFTEGDTLIITSVEDGTELSLDKNNWKEKFTCRHHGGEKSYEFAFSIRQYKDNDLSALLILPDLTYYSGALERDGLNWRFNWNEAQKNYTVLIKPDASAYYYDWSLADSDGRMEVRQGYKCK